jgi:murein DD-endopeptidase MepM/ murein hydrolase activator NlpD
VRKLFSIISIIVLMVPIYVGADAASDQAKIDELKAQIDQLEKQKQSLQGTINQTAERAATLSQQIANLKNQIVSLQVQIQLTGKKIDQTSLEITSVQDTILTTQQKIDYQKNTIGDLLLYLHKRDQESLVGVIMKSANLSDYFNEQQYAMTVNATLLNIVSDLKKDEDSLKNQKDSLESKKNNLETLKHQQNAQQVSLASVQSDTSHLLAETKGQEAQYQKLLTTVENQENTFFTQLRELETHVIQGGLYIVHVTADALPKKGTKLFQWPETGYRVTQGYGCTTYARCGRSRGPYGGAPHNGIDLASGFGSPIKAIAEGQIIANGRNDGWGNWAAIQHPNQYNLVSIYAHMSALSFLQVGTAVEAGQVIGYEGNTGNAEGSHLHLSIYKDFFTYVNTKKDQLYFNYFEGTINPLDYL